MPRREIGETLEKVVSTKISYDDFNLLEKYAKIAYNHNIIRLPTISHMLRRVIQDWASSTRDSEQPNKGRRAIRLSGE